VTVARAARFVRRLLARRCATLMARRRQSVVSPHGWRALALRWRRSPRRKPALVLNSRTVHAAQVVWSPQFHVQLTSEARQAARPAPFAFVRPAQVMRDTRHRVQTLFRTIYRTERVAGPVQWLNRVEGDVPAAARATAAPRGPLPQLFSDRQFRSTQRVAGPVQWLERMTREDLVPAATAVRTPALPLVGRRSAPRRGHRHSPELTLSSRAMRSASRNGPLAARRPFRAAEVVQVSRSSQWRQRATAPVGRRTGQLLLPKSPLTATLGRAVDHPYPSIDIVWSRRRSAAGTSAELESDGRLSRASVWTASVPPPPAEPRSPVSRQPPPSPASLKLSDIDPRLMDRLTDNVIRRVERHVRIERERRGL